MPFADPRSRHVVPAGQAVTARAIQRSERRLDTAILTLFGDTAEAARAAGVPPLRGLLRVLLRHQQDRACSNLAGTTVRAVADGSVRRYLFARRPIVPARTILELGNPGLWQRSRPVDRPADVRQVIADLADTLAHFRAAHGFGRGIAAPQIGALERVIFIRMPDGFTGPLVNPVVEWASGEKMELWDDCFSLPGLMVRVSRSARVRVSYLDEDGSARRVEADGGLSELLQHEIDHLDGILAIDRAISPQALCSRAEWERRHRGAA